MKNEWGATLAGDLAQTALLKRRSQTYIGPDGWFNTSLCPRGEIDVNYYFLILQGWPDSFDLMPNLKIIFHCRPLFSK